MKTQKFKLFTFEYAPKPTGRKGFMFKTTSLGILSNCFLKTLARFLVFVSAMFFLLIGSIGSKLEVSVIELLNK